MNQEKIGKFLKELRKQKGLTQEQIAEKFNVSNRTISRWENGNNMPDLDILIEISDYYEVDLREILNGERKSENMDKELKETLLKVADYNELEKQQAVRAGNISFRIMFLVCALAVIIQMVVTGNMSLVVGETVIMVAGGLVYIYYMVKNGAWDERQTKSTRKRDLVVSMICTGIFSIAYYLVLKKNVDFIYAIGGAICFFIVFSAGSYAFLRGISRLSKKKSDKLKGKSNR